MLRDRTFQTACLALVMTAVGLFARPRSPELTGMSYEAFVSRKMTARGRWDVVLAGDSRTQMGLLPDAMSLVLSGLRIFNFGFDHNGYAADYLDALESMLDPESSTPTLVLGITPQLLTPEAAENGEFAYLAARRPTVALYNRFVGVRLAAFAPYDLRPLFDEVRGRPRTLYYRYYSPDGSIASWKEPEDTLLQVRRYEGRFDGNQVSDTLQAQLVSRVTRWRKAGIEVFAIRLPTSAPMRDLEERESGFDEDAFVDEFERAGGHWIPVPPGRYHTHDGSHLHERSARELSRRIAEEIEHTRVPTHDGTIRGGP